ncbi:hypothetical protein [Blautia wexlerae]|uniref:hypothetical protein n=1 Tax=Blautia wexlerae TaxID=418240 RepID=UPI0003F6F43A|nr:hypothetical protein [Blautia wexlerae]
MKLADVMDKVEVGMKMVVRSEYNPEYEVFGGKVVEKKGVYLCLEVDGILHGLSAKENYEVLKLFDKNGVELIERDVWEIIEKYVPEVESPEQVYSAALDVWGCYTAEVKRKVSFALAELMTDDDMEWFFDELSDKHRQIANLLGYEDDSENIDEETEDIIEERVENTEDYDPDAYEEDGTEESLYLENTALKKLMEIQMMLEKIKQKDEQKESVNA